MTVFTFSSSILTTPSGRSIALSCNEQALLAVAMVTDPSALDGLLGLVTSLISLSGTPRKKSYKIDLTEI